jgi:hypothetical protein
MLAAFNGPFWLLTFIALLSQMYIYHRIMFSVFCALIFFTTCIELVRQGGTAGIESGTWGRRESLAQLRNFL